MQVPRSNGFVCLVECCIPRTTDSAWLLEVLSATFVVHSIFFEGPSKLCRKTELKDKFIFVQNILKSVHVCFII